MGLSLKHYQKADTHKDDSKSQEKQPIGSLNQNSELYY